VGVSGAATYQWDLGNGNTATVRDAQAIYTAEGSYTVTLTVRDGGNVQTASHVVTVYAHSAPSFSYTPGQVCGPQPISFTGSAQGPAISSWLWDFGDGGTSRNGQAAAQHVYTADFSGTASLTVTNIYGCTDTVTQPVAVKVLTPATSSFYSDKRVLCLATDPVQFTASGTGPAPLTYSWDFGDGNTSTLPNPAHSYAQKGNYTVTLKTTAANACSANVSQVNYLNVANYSTDFDFPSKAVCQTTGTIFNDRSSPVADSRVWTVDGNIYSYYSPMTYNWATPGTHVVTLSNMFGTCPQSASHTVTVNPMPAVSPVGTAITLACDHYTEVFTENAPTAVSWYWDFNGTEVMTTGPTWSNDYPYNNVTYIRVTAIDANGCFNSAYVSAYQTKSYPSIYEPSPSLNTSCGGSVTKTYAISGLSLLQSWHWAFGDGATSTEASPTHTYSGPGTYVPVLYYTDNTGCSSSVSFNAVVISNPFTADLSATPTTVCVGSQVNFTPVFSGGAGVNYVQWGFGDGGGSSSSYWTYHQPGTYTVTLSAQNAGGCTASVTKTAYINVLAAPGTYGSYTNTCDGDRLTVTFGYTPGTADKVVWDFGDGVKQTTDPRTTQVQHTYPATGTYFPTVVASNSQCSTTNTDRVMVLKKQNLVLSSSSPIACTGGTLDVYVAAESNPREVYSGYNDDYAPQFAYADGTPFGGTVSYGSWSNGLFHWTLSGFTPGKSGLQVVTKSFGFGCTDVSNTIPLTVRGSAVAAFNIVSDHQCYTSPVVLQDATTPGVNNSIVAESWSFGDGQVSNQVGGTISHTYSDPGGYMVRLTVTDAAGCTSTTNATGSSYVVANGPKAAFSASGTDVNLNSTVYFYNSTNYFGSSNTVFSWDFGDGGTSSDYYPSHTYTAPGVYVVTLTVKDASGVGTCVSTAKLTINVRNFNSHFSTTTSYVGTSGCPPVLAQFVNTSQNYVSVSWDFGDGWTAGNVNTPGHVYQKPGRYIVTLFVKGYNGLTAQWVDSVFVRQPVADLSAVKPMVCLGQPSVYQGTGSAIKTFTWDFGDGSVGQGVYPDSVAMHVYKAGGDYMTRLVVTDSLGCQAASDVAVDMKVHDLPRPVVAPDSPYVCLNSSTKLTATGGVSYLWSPAVGLDRVDVAGVVAAPVMNTVYQVVATDDAGCQGSTSVLVKVTAPQLVTVTPDTASICMGDEVRMTEKGADVYRWIGDIEGDGGQGVIVAKPSESTVLMVIGTDFHACFADTVKIPITVRPVPTVNGGPDVEVLAGDPVLLAATGSADVVAWSWTPPDYLSCADCAQPVASPKRPEEYVVKVTNGVACSATDTVVAKILCEESRVRIPDAFSPNGDGRNDRFMIMGIGLVKHIVIYDRWGIKVFERSNFYPVDAGASWDGMFNGYPAPVGTYVYFVEMECPAGGAFARRGTVVLVR